MTSGGGRSPGPDDDDGPSLRDALTRLEGAVRFTALLLVVAPLLDLVLGLVPWAPNQVAWRIAAARGLASGLVLPAAGALTLAVLAVARPGRLATGLAVTASAIGAILGGLATGVLIPEAARTVAGSALVGREFATLAPLWAAVQALVIVGLNLAIAWGAGRHGYREPPGAAPPAPRLVGIDLLD